MRGKKCLLVYIVIRLVKTSKGTLVEKEQDVHSPFLEQGPPPSFYRDVPWTAEKYPWWDQIDIKVGGK